MSSGLFQVLVPVLVCWPESLASTSPNLPNLFPGMILEQSPVVLTSMVLVEWPCRQRRTAPSFWELKGSAAISDPEVGGSPRPPYLQLRALFDLLHVWDFWGGSRAPPLWACRKLSQFRPVYNTSSSLNAFLFFACDLVRASPETGSGRFCLLSRSRTGAWEDLVRTAL